MPDKLRLFIAIDLDKTTRQQLTAIQAKLKTSNADVKWVEPQNIHLTLQFLGSTPTEQISEIKASIDAIANQLSAFKISLSKIGAFPNISSPRVIWVGIQEGADKLEKIADALNNKEFSAHLTLGRIRSSKGRLELKKTIEDTNKKLATSASKRQSPVNHITLFQSTLTPQGPVYTNLYEATIRPS